MSSRHVAARLTEVAKKMEALETRICDRNGENLEVLESLMREHTSLCQVEAQLSQELLGWVDPRGSVARTGRLRSSDSWGSSNRYGFDKKQAVEMKCVLDAFIRVHNAARAGASEETVALLSMPACDRACSREIRGGKGAGWVAAKLVLGHRTASLGDGRVGRLGGEARCGETQLRLSYSAQIWRGGGWSAAGPPRTIQRPPTWHPGCDEVDGRPATTPRSTVCRRDYSILPLLGGVYEVAVSLHDFAEELGRSQVRAYLTMETLLPPNVFVAKGNGRRSTFRGKCVVTITFFHWIVEALYVQDTIRDGKPDSLSAVGSRLHST